MLQQSFKFLSTKLFWYLPIAKISEEPIMIKKNSCNRLIVSTLHKTDVQ